MLSMYAAFAYSPSMFSRLLVWLFLSALTSSAALGAEAAHQSADAPPPRLSLAVFDIDATPPTGSMMAYDPVTNKWDLILRARGVVLLGAGRPIVLCAVDWIGIANEGYDAFRSGLAKAASTTAERVALHTLHQHDAPDCDLSAEQLLKEAGLEPRQF